MSKIIITLEGGIIQSVVSSNSEDEVLTLDLDSEGADPDEIIGQKEVDEFLNGEKVHELNFTGGVLEDNVNLTKQV